jgi:hypothetical protein
VLPAPSYSGCGAGPAFNASTVKYQLQQIRSGVILEPPAGERGKEDVMRRLYILILLLAAAVIAQGQPHRAWAQRYDGGFVQGGGDSSPLCASDSSGNVYVAGATSIYWMSEHQVGSNLTLTRYNSQGNKQWLATYINARNVRSIKVDPEGDLVVFAEADSPVLLKYNAQGDLLWAWNDVSAGLGKALAMDLDAQGNIYVASSGYFPSQSGAVTTTKISPAGDLLWQKHAAVTSGYHASGCLDVDHNGNVWLAHTFAENTNAIGIYLRIVKYDQNGNELFNTLSNEYLANHIEADAHGNAYVMLSSRNSVCGAKLWKIDGAGNEIWNACASGISYPAILPLALNRQGNVAVTGLTNASDTKTIIFDTAGTGLWTHTIDIPSASAVVPAAIMYSSLGEIMITGEVIAANGKSDFFTAQYSSTGDLNWISQYGVPSMLNDRATGMALLPGGKTVVTGEATFSSGRDFLTLCYDSNGSGLWLDSIDGKSPSIERPFAQDIDPVTGDIYQVGQGKSVELNSDMITVKYRADGTVAWARYFPGEAGEQDIGWSVKADGMGNVYSAGRTMLNTSPRINEARLIKYDGNGNILWMSAYPDSGYMAQEEVLLAVDESGGVYAGTVSGSFKLLVIRYDSNGQLVWKQEYAPENYYGWTNISGIRLDVEGNLYAAGTAIPYLGAFIMSTVKFSADGTLLWEKETILPGSPASRAAGIEVDKTGNAYVTGHITDAGGIHKFITVKFNATGSEEWITISDKPANTTHTFSSLTLDASGNVYILGMAVNAGDSGYSRTAAIKLGSNGKELWRQTLGDQHMSYSGSEITAAGSGMIYITGGVYTSQSWDRSIFTAALSPEGEMKWIDTLSGGNGYAVNVHPDGGVYVAGSVGDTYEGLDMVLIRYDQEPLSIENILAARTNVDVSIFPNPAQGSFTLEVDAEACIEIFDLSGKKVQCMNMKKGGSRLAIDVSNLKAGSYVVRAVTRQGVVTKPLVVLSER